MSSKSLDDKFKEIHIYRLRIIMFHRLLRGIFIDFRKKLDNQVFLLIIESFARV